MNYEKQKKGMRDFCSTKLLSLSTYTLEIKSYPDMELILLIKILSIFLSSIYLFGKMFPGTTTLNNRQKGFFFIAEKSFK